MEYQQQVGTHSSSSSSRSSINSSVMQMGFDPPAQPVIKLPSDDDLRKEGIENVLKRLRIAEHDQRRMSRIINDQNQMIHRLQHQALQLRDLNQRLTLEKNKLIVEKEELTGLVCFVDDDRHKAKRCCREWQKYGRYAHSAMQKEVTNFHGKIKELEHKQMLVVEDNTKLKEIILMLNQENHTGGSRDSVNSQNSIPSSSGPLLSVSGTRDSGDGSSNGSTTGSSSPDHRAHRKEANLYSSDPSQGINYVRYLEHKVRHLEEESKGRMKNIQATTSVASSSSSSEVANQVATSSSVITVNNSSTTTTTTDTSTSCCRLPQPTHHPVLLQCAAEHSGVEPPPLSPLITAQKLPPPQPPLSAKSSSVILDEKERASVRDMCNTVWKKLADNKQRMLSSSKQQQKTQSVSEI